MNYRMFKSSCYESVLIKVTTKEKCEAFVWYSISVIHGDEEINFLDLYCKFDDDCRFYWQSNKELIDMEEILGVVDLLRKEFVLESMFTGELVKVNEMVEIHD